MQIVAIIGALMALLVPPSKQPGETESEATDRYHVIATAIADEAGQDRRLTLFLLTVARHESTFKASVHSGAERGDAGHSWSLFQLKLGRAADSRVPRTDYVARDIVGVGPRATRRAVDAAATWLRPLIEGCRGAPLCSFARYGGVDLATADAITMDRLAARVRTYNRLVAESQRHAR
jgi:hypothetical protein